jgi:2'-hydroxyisoflavone reductase
LKILILGGTRFQGKYLSNTLVHRGHEVTVFHRGTHAADPSIVRDVTGNRDNPVDLQQLAGMEFDWVVDTCAYLPGQIRAALSVLSKSVRNYCFISSSYVYRPQGMPAGETAPREVLPPDADAGVFRVENYGALKVLCEDELGQFKGRSLILRPSIIVGPGDHTGRFAFWVRLMYRLNAGILPGPGSIQLIDVRDLVDFAADCIESQKVGPVNVAAPVTGLSEMFEEMARALSASGRQSIESIDQTRLPSPLPLTGEKITVQTSLAREWGLKTRPISSTTLDVLEFEKSAGLGRYPLSELEEHLVKHFS